ncbi:MAG: glycerophosphodiester phosphodiesterase [bacterium]
MPISDLLERIFVPATDFLFARLAQPCPDPALLDQVRLVAHRGEHDNRHLLENTLPAFDAALEDGTWGIELDIRWTKDLEPVVFHDRDLRRLFGSGQQIAQMTLRELRKGFPRIPPLESVVERYGGKMHLMAELKEERWPDPARQNRKLSDLFRLLAPESDFHLLSLAPSVFEQIEFAPPSCFLPVAERNVDLLSSLSLNRRYAGLAAHYLLLTRPILEKHKAAGQKVATGHIASINCLYREINRGVDWIFTNMARRIRRECVLAARSS